MIPTYIYDAVRTPRGRGHAEKGGLREIPPIDLLKTVFDAIQKRSKLDTSLVDQIALGCNTVTGEQGANLAKIASLYAGWHHQANGVTVSSFCTSGLEAVQLAAMKIMTGSAKCAVAGGVESMSRVPMFSDNGPWFHDQKVASKTGYIHMGLAADLIANLEGFSTGDLNQYTIGSHRRSLEAWNLTSYKRDVVPVMRNGKPLMIRDEGIRGGIRKDQLNALEPIFDPKEQAATIKMILAHVRELESFECRHTVANAPQLADAASLILLGNRALARKIGKQPIARLSGFASISVEPVVMLSGVVDATKLLLKQQKLKLSDIDLFEVNESFAAVPLLFMRRLGIDASKVNVSGGAIALGHPLGATGAILIGTLIHNLKHLGKKRGVVTICGGAGIAHATLVEVM